MPFKNNNKQTKYNDNSFSLEEGTIAEKTSFVENLNRLIGHINHVAVYNSAGNYVDGVKQLKRMLTAYLDDTFYADLEKIQLTINIKAKGYDQKDREQWMEDNSTEIYGEIFGALMRLMSRAGLSPIARITSIDLGEGA